MTNPYEDWATPTSQPSQPPPAQQYGNEFNQTPPSQPPPPAYTPPAENTGYKKPYQNSGKPPMDIVIPGKYVAIAIHVGKDMPADKIELLNMMLGSMASNEFTARVGVNNDACQHLNNFIGQNPELATKLKREYVRPWKDFTVESFASGENGWYPAMSVTKSCEILIPALASKEDKGRSFKVLEGALICGRAAKQTARILITYSPDGVTSHTKAGKDSAYMQNVIRFAQMFGITVINLGAEDARQKYGMFLNQFITE